MNFNLKKLNAIIPIVSGGVMVVWGFLANDWSKCWLSVFVGGILMAIINVLGANKDGKNK